MAAKDNYSGDIEKKELEGITTCCICIDTFTDPKALPCLHTYCMKCLQETGLQTNKGPGDEMPCPICRRQFKIPLQGFSGLPKNFFIERLIQMANIPDPPASSKALCYACLEESNLEKGKKIPAADVYCVDCKYKLCEECCGEHKRFKLTKNHKLIPINEHEDQNAMGDPVPSVCELHEQKVLDVYCADCKTVICAICFIDDHNSHKGSHVNKFVEGFRKQIESNTEAVKMCSSRAQVKKAELLKVKEDMQQRVANFEYNVMVRKDELKHLTDKHANSLLQDLCLLKQSQLKEIEVATGDIDAYLSCLESYNSYCQTIMAKGSASDICRTAFDLSVRGVELQQQCQPLTEREIWSFKFCFTKSDLEDFLEQDRGNLIGAIKDEDDSKQKRSKESLIAEQRKEIDLLRQGMEMKRKEKTNLHSANEQLILNINIKEQANKVLIQQLDKEKASNTEHINKLTQELENEKQTNKTLQANIKTLVQELNRDKATIRTLEANGEKLRQELDTERKRNDHMKQDLKKSNAEKFRSEYKGVSGLVQTIRTHAAMEKKKSICGLTILDKELFVVIRDSSEVEVYHSLKLSFSRRWSLNELLRPAEIGSCNRNKCLYVCDHKNDDQSCQILRVAPNGKLIKNWSTGDDRGQGLSVTDESNVILTVYDKNKLKEYSSDGLLIREINLSSDSCIRNPMHAVKLTSGDFVVSHGRYDSDQHRVSIVDAEGKLQKSFGGKHGSNIGQMNFPIHLAVDGSGFVMVADLWNSRILLLDSGLEFRREIVSNEEKYGLRHPVRIVLDESNDRLFVADSEWDPEKLIPRYGRIFIFQLKQLVKI